MMVSWLFPEWILRWAKWLFRLRSPALELYAFRDKKNQNLQSHLGKNLKLFISATDSHYNSSVFPGMLYWWIEMVHGQWQWAWFGFVTPLSSGHRGFRRVKRFSFHFICISLGGLSTIIPFYCPYTCQNLNITYPFDKINWSPPVIFHRSNWEQNTLILLCKDKRQYLLSCKVSRYCFWPLHRSIYL